MRILDYMERLQTLTRLLKKEHTGSAAKIAKEMGVHRNTIINYFLELRAMGAEIEYDNERNTYYFKKSFGHVLDESGHTVKIFLCLFQFQIIPSNLQSFYL